MSARLMIAIEGNTSLCLIDIKRLQNPIIGGVILFARNFSDGQQLRQLTSSIRRHANRPILIAVDQEGGRVQRFCDNGFTALPAMQDIADYPQATKVAEATGIVLAAELLSHGIDFSFTPVLDINYGHSTIIGTRSFSSDPHTVAKIALCLMQGLKQAGMAACGKHFPGHGYVTADSHLELPIDTRDASIIWQNDLIPFQAFIEAKGDLLMTAHIVYQAVDEQAATFSSVWLKTVLRQELGYTGQIVCDDLSMEGAKSIGDCDQRIKKASMAGCDLFLACQPPDIADTIQAVQQLDDNQEHQQWTSLCQRHTRIGIGDAIYREAKTTLLQFQSHVSSPKN